MDYRVSALLDLNRQKPSEPSARDDAVNAALHLPSVSLHRSSAAAAWARFRSIWRLTDLMSAADICVGKRQVYVAGVLRTRRDHSGGDPLTNRANRQQEAGHPLRS